MRISFSPKKDASRIVYPNSTNGRPLVGFMLTEHWHLPQIKIQPSHTSMDRESSINCDDMEFLLHAILQSLKTPRRMVPNLSWQMLTAASLPSSFCRFFTTSKAFKQLRSASLNLPWKNCNKAAWSQIWPKLGSVGFNTDSPARSPTVFRKFSSHVQAMRFKNKALLAFFLLFRNVLNADFLPKGSSETFN